MTEAREDVVDLTIGRALGQSAELVVVREAPVWARSDASRRFSGSSRAAATSAFALFEGLRAG
jgi:hypothetical protein